MARPSPCRSPGSPGSRRAQELPLPAFGRRPRKATPLARPRAKSKPELAGLHREGGPSRREEDGLSPLVLPRRIVHLAVIEHVADRIPCEMVEPRDHAMRASNGTARIE